nr:hypothetical protein [Azospirillum thiophilum]
MRPKKPLSRSMRSFSRPGRNSLSCTVPFFTPASAASRTTRSASSRLVAIGFSQ